MLNNMSIERSTMTIDGMHILARVPIKWIPSLRMWKVIIFPLLTLAGQEGSLARCNVAGNIDLKEKALRSVLKRNGTARIKQVWR